MTHTNYTVDTSYFSLESGSFYHGGLLNETLAAYIINPTALQNLGLSSNSALTIEQFNTFRTTLTVPLIEPSAEDFLLSNWIAKGWGSDPAGVLTKYNAFINAHIESGGSIRAAFNPRGLPTTSIVANGDIQDISGKSAYFFPILVFSAQSDLDPTAGGGGGETAPVLIQALAGNLSESTASITATYTGTATNFLIEKYIGISPNGSWQTFDSGVVSGGSPFVYNQIPRDGNTQYYRTSVSNGAGSSDTYSVTITGGSGGNIPTITINTQPANSSIADGGNTSFSVDASVTQSATLNYQWQKQEGGVGYFNNVFGETSSSIDINNASYSTDSGDVYRVIVGASGSATSKTSNGATLTVSAPIVAPTINSATAQNYSGSNSLLTVNYSGNATSYVIESYLAGWNSYSSGSFSDSGTLLLLVSRTGPGNLYRITLTGSVGSSSPQEFMVQVNSQAQTTITNITTDYDTETYQLTIDWANSIDFSVNSYAVQYYTGTGSGFSDINPAHWALEYSGGAYQNPLSHGAMLYPQAEVIRIRVGQAGQENSYSEWQFVSIPASQV